MGWAVHLSDLHLGTLNPDQESGEYKEHVIPVREREQRRGRIRAALRNIALKAPLEAVFVTGDVTYQNDQGGYDELPSLLSEIPSFDPHVGPVVVVPGNHDVERYSEPSSRARYLKFLALRDHDSWITPLLEGVDIDAEGNLEPGVDLAKHFLLADDGTWLALPINSSNYCMTQEPVSTLSDSEWQKVCETVERSSVGSAKLLEHLRDRDVARISPAQRNGLSKVLSAAEEEMLRRGIDPKGVIRVALLHHHLLPVTTSEEIKPYESIVNLGVVRDFFRAHKIHLVCHGHKHVGRIYFDHVYDYASTPRVPTEGTEILVVSGGTVGPEQGYGGSEALRLMRTVPEYGRYGIDVAIVRGEEAGAPAPPIRWATFALGMRPESRYVTAPSMHEGYSKLLARFAAWDVSQVTSLICELATPTGAAVMPANYPVVPDADTELERQTWFDRQVRWWQQTDSALEDQPQYFTHGSRIFRFGLNSDGSEINQFRTVAHLLRTKRHTSRGVAILLDPRRDDLHEKFPALAIVQFQIVDRDGPRLALMAYFRKQEIRFWWPVNVAELSLLQRRMMDELRDVIPELKAGPLTTIAGVAELSESIPLVAIPEVDLLRDEDKASSLWSLVYALFGGPHRAEVDYATTWKRIRRDLIPPETPNRDGSPVPTAGIRFLADTAEQFSKHHHDSPAVGIVGPLKSLYKINREHATEVSAGGASLESHVDWRDKVTPLVDQIDQIVRVTCQIDP